jgi:predicted component of type VI protein secretion system
MESGRRLLPKHPNKRIDTTRNKTHQPRWRESIRKTMEKKSNTPRNSRVMLANSRESSEPYPVVASPFPLTSAALE